MKPEAGSIYRIPSHGIVIINGVRTVKTTSEEYEVVDWISFTMRNSRGTIRMKNWYMSVDCGCTYNDTYGDNSNPTESDCRVCNGSGLQQIVESGFDKSTFLAYSCKDYIVKTLTKPFNF